MNGSKRTDKAIEVSFSRRSVTAGNRAAFPRPRLLGWAEISLVVAGFFSGGNRVLSLAATSVLSAMVICVTWMTSVAPAGDFTFPSSMTVEEVRGWVDRREVDHPRLLTSGEELAQLRESLDAYPLRKALAEGVLGQADGLLEAAPITRKLTGRRLLGQSRRCVKRLLTLAMAFHLSGEEKYARRAEKEMLAVAAFEDWNPSHFLDVAEMTFAMAVGYDWLFHELVPENRETIRDAIVGKGVALPFNSRHNGWVRASNNWGQVCHGGLTAGALAVLEDEPALAAKTVHNALHNVRHAMAAYAPHGGYPEGPGYWTYGTSYNVLLIAVLESALGSDFGLTKAPGFSRTGQFPALACGPSGLYFNYADGGAGRRTGPTLFWFAKRFDRPDWLLGEFERLEETIARFNGRKTQLRGGRLLPLVLLWMQPEPDDVEIRMPLHWSSEGKVPITIHRSSWTDPDATFVGFKGGSPSANHGQMDIGSFVLDADGVRWALDLGAEGYHGIESRGMNLWSRGQDSDRWTIFRQSNAGHNTLVIDGRLQRAAGKGEIVEFSDDPSFPCSVLDMSSVYEDQAESVRRGVALLPSGEVLIRDELSGVEAGATVRWGMITQASLKGTGRPLAELQREDANLELRIVKPRGATWEKVDTATPKNPWDSPNQGTRMVAFECSVPSSGSLTFVVRATPGSCNGSAKESVADRPLKEWGD
ncbi:MAG: heparinase II/III domain-containing protein [Planctomycetota bacterium]